MKKLLVTGFGPFPRVPRNPSEALARAAAAHPRWRRLDVGAEALVLDTAFSAIEENLLPALRRYRPDAVIMLGVAARRPVVTIETRARNRVGRLLPDAEGRIALHPCLRPGGPSGLRSRTPMPSILRTFQESRVPARLSRDAGRYLCNAAYYAALAEAPDTIILFIHIPMPDKGARPANGASKSIMDRTRKPPFPRLVEAVVYSSSLLLLDAARRARRNR